MTRDEWARGTHPGPILRLYESNARVDELRLFGVICCRRFAPMNLGLHACRGIEVAERLLTGHPTPADLTQLLDDLLYEGIAEGVDNWYRPEHAVRWHAALAIFNCLQEKNAFHAGVRWPTFDATLPSDEEMFMQDQVLHFALYQTKLEALTSDKAIFYRSDLCVPDLTRVWYDAARAVAYSKRLTNRPKFGLLEGLLRPELHSQSKKWQAEFNQDYTAELAHQTDILRRINSEKNSG